METLTLIGFIFLLIFIYGLFADKLTKLSISGPMVFTVFGLIASDYIQLEELQLNSTGMIVIGQIALMAILFTDASGISLNNFFKVYKIPMRLLFIGLPITMIIGTLVARSFFVDFAWAALAMMAFILSPTDAALGQAVVKSPKVPNKIRESINVESGLNDGLVLPPVLICAAILKGGTEGLEIASLLTFVGKQLIVATIIGIALGWAGTKLINWSSTKKYINNFYQGICTISIPIISFVVAEHFGGNGFIATFIAGLVFSLKSKKASHTGMEFGEVLSQPLTLFVFFIFGAIIFPYYIEYMSLEVIIYALLSLTLLRIIPVILSLANTGVSMKEKIFIGWFGPRGIASILYFLIVFDIIGERDDYDQLFAVIMLTIMLSIFAHGLSAVPYSNLIGRSSSKSDN